MTNSSALSRANPADGDGGDSLTSVIVPCYRSLSTLQDLIVSLEQQSDAPPFEVVLVDNGPTSGIEGLVSDHSALLDIKLVAATAGAGTAYARNVGVRSASGDILLFVDHDDTVGERYLRAMTHALTEHRFVCSRIDFKVLNAAYFSAWPFSVYTQFQQSGAIVIRGTKPVHFGSGGTLGLRREVYDKVGPFAEDIPYCDDIDFCIRAHLAAEMLTFVPDAVLHYRLREGIRKTFRQRLNWSKAEALVYKKHASAIGWVTPDIRQHLRDWWFLVRSFRYIRSPWGRMWLATWGGERVGRLLGSISCLVFFL